MLGNCFVSPLSYLLPSLMLIIGIPTMLHSWLTRFYMRNSCNTASTTYTIDDIDGILWAGAAVAVVQPIFTASVSVCLPSYPTIEYLRSPNELRHKFPVIPNLQLIVDIWLLLIGIMCLRVIVVSAASISWPAAEHSHNYYS